MLRKALTTKSEGFVQVTRWQQLCGLFAAMDKGLPALGIHAYNGGLFAPDPSLDALIVSEASLDSFSALSDHDFETDLNVNILGHIFEQSITDLEQIRAEIRGGVADQQQSRRKRDGIFYTPDLITRFMVARAIGGWLAARYTGIEARYRTGKPGPLSNETRLKIWLNYLEVLQHIKVLDLACGSGAFLVAAFNYLLAEYERVNRAIGELTGAPGQLGLFDLDRQILQGNLFGVDLNPLAARGKRRVLVTNAHQKAIALKMRKTRLVGHLERIISAHDLGLAKETPGFWPLVQAIEPFDPERTLFVDDSPKVLRAARNYGFRHLLAVLAPDSMAPPNEAGAYPAIHGFGELLPGLRR